MKGHAEHITFFVDPAWKLDGYSPLLYPFWGNPLDPARTPFHHALFERHTFDTNFYSITADPSAADMVLMPTPHTLARRVYPDLFDSCLAKAGELGLPLLVDGIGDVEYPLPQPNVLVLRYGGYRFEKKKNEIHIPPYADDLLEIYCQSELQIKKKSHVPVVGFAGWGQLSLKQKMRSFAKELPDRLHGIFDSRFRAKKKGVFFRAEAIALLESSPLLKADILRRSSYSGHAETATGSAERIRREFVDNLLQSDYGLDIRGDANASTRLYEMLSLGCVPVIVDTERNFPFDDEVDYSSFALIVDFRDMHELPQRIAQFHAQISEEQFAHMQERARDAFVKHFRVDALMPHIVRAIQQKLLHEPIA